MKTPLRLLLTLLPAWLACPNLSAAEPLRVAASTTDVASLARQIGGDHVSVFCFSKGPEDPHVIELLPSFVRELQQAELFIQVGLGIENAWLKDLVTRAGNDRVKPGAPGNLNLGEGVRRLEGGEGADAVPGSFHEEGNPHYLLDPVEGLKAARRICDKFVALRPSNKAAFETRHAQFVEAWAIAFLGEKLAVRANLGTLEDFENSNALEAELAKLARDAGPNDGIAGSLSPFRGVVVVGDHDLWPYFARRYGLEVLGYLEPSPGVPPTTKHLGELIDKMKAAEVRVVLTAPYFDQRHGRFVSERTGAKVIPMAHQTGGRPGTDEYLDMVRHNATQLMNALRKSQ
ncbi:MAG: metal ABC transporter substrate-binding protein [Limisphaerales bacterium]